MLPFEQALSFFKETKIHAGHAIVVWACGLWGDGGGFGEILTRMAAECKADLIRPFEQVRRVIWLSMAFNAGWYAAQLRRELAARARVWSAGRAHVESYGPSPVMVFSPEESAGAPKHGNFFDDAYRAIESRPGWRR